MVREQTARDLVARPARRLVLAAAAGLAFCASLGAAAPALADEAPWSPIIAPAALEALADRNPLILDIRAGALRKGGPSFYEVGHVPGSVSAPYGRWRGPTENPGERMTSAEVQALLRSLGAEKDRPTVVVFRSYTASDFGAAARVYWTLKSAGIERIAILDGGVLGWVASGRPLSTEAAAPKPSDIEIALDQTWTASEADVLAATAKGALAKLIDARPVAFFRGEVKHKAAKKPGTLANATQLEHSTWFQPGSPQIGDAKAVRAALASRGYSAADAQGAISFCNTGHWAATNWFALSEIAGLKDVKLYPESMVGWTLVGNPVTNGAVE